MVFTDILGSIEDGFKIDDCIELDEFNKDKKTFKITSISGLEIEVNVNRALLNDEVISNKDINILVKLKAQDVMIAYLTSIEQMGKLAHFVGGLKLKAIFEGSRIITLPNEMLKNYLEDAKIKYEITNLVLQKPLK